MQHVDVRLSGWLAGRFPAKYLCRTIHHLWLPFHNLVGLHIERLCRPTSVLSPCNAANATLALNPAAGFLLVLLMRLLLCWPCAARFGLSKTITYRPVQISEATSPTAVSRKLVGLTATKLTAFPKRSLAECTPCALFLDTIHRGGEAFLVALGVDLSGEKMALGCWQGSSENHEICEALFRDLERRGLALSRRILFVTDGGSGLIKALRARFDKKLVHQRCAIHKSRNVQRHLAKPYRKEAHRQLTIALEQTSYADAKHRLLELDAWLRTKNESAAESLLEAFEELLTVHRLKVPALLRKTLMSTNPIERMFSLVRHSERNSKRSRGSAMLQRWLGTGLRYGEQQFKRVTGVAGIAEVMATIEAEHAEPHLVQAKKAA